MTLKDKILKIPKRSDLAKRAGIDQTVLSNWIAGRRSISDEAEVRLEKALNESLAEIMASPPTLKEAKRVIMRRGDDYRQITNGIQYSESEGNYLVKVGKESKVFKTLDEAKAWRKQKLNERI